MEQLMLNGDHAMRFKRDSNAYSRLTYASGLTYNRDFFGSRGFTYIGLLLFIAITGVGLSVVGMSWQYQVRAEKEKELLFVGAEFRDAISSYYTSTPDATKVYPVSLNDLLLDKRMPDIKRHLRKIYLDPMTGKADWGVVKSQGRITGIYSKSTLAPFKQKGFKLADASFAGLRLYREWLFVGSGLEKKSQSSTSLSIPDTINQNQPSNTKASTYLNEQFNQDNTSSPRSTENNSSSEAELVSTQSNVLKFYKKDGVLHYGYEPNN